MTLAEIMAGLGASQAVGGARTGALLTQTVEGERRDLRDARKRLEEQQKERDRKAKRRDKRRGFGRLVGGGIGFLLGGAPGAAIGSAIGQGGAAATQRGGYKLDDVSAGLGQGMFFKGGREDISTAERDINRYLDDANTGFITNIATSAVSDYLTAGQLGKAFPGIRGGGFKAIGDAINRWIDSRNVRPKTLESYNWSVKHLLNFIPRDYPIANITPQVITDYKKYLEDSLNLSPNSVKINL